MEEQSCASAWLGPSQVPVSSSISRAGVRPDAVPSTQHGGHGRVCAHRAWGPAAARGPYLDSGHHSSGDPRLTAHPGGFSCRVKRAVKYVLSSQAWRT